MYFNENDDTIKKFWHHVGHMVQQLLAPLIFVISLFSRRELHSTSYLLALLKSKWYHWRCELPAGRFIFGLYFCIIATGTTLLVLSQYKDWYFGPVNVNSLLEQLRYRWDAEAYLAGVNKMSFPDFVSWHFKTAYSELIYLLYNIKLGPINYHNCNLLVDALFTATSATCLTGMTTTDVAKYPPLVLVVLMLTGAASLIILALTFNINNFFSSESSSHGALRLDEYGEGRRLGSFTLKTMFTCIMFGILALTFYFLPNTAVVNFLHSEISSFFSSLQENLLLVLICLAPVLLLILVLYHLRNSIKQLLRKIRHWSSLYYMGVTGIVAVFLLWLYYAEGHWELRDYFGAVARAIFLSVSAFTNCGLDTYSNDLAQRMGSQNASQWMTFIIMILIFFGTLGMQVVRELPHVLAEVYRTLLSRRFSLKRLGMKISFNTKLILLTNIFLWIFAALMLWFFETQKGNSLAGLTPLEIFCTTAFQSMNMRTAGFSIHADVSMYSHPTLLLIMVMMIIGGSPNSMSGGMKVSTAAILFMVAKSLLERRDGVYAFGEKLSQESINKAMTTFVLTVSALVLALILVFSFYDGLQEDYFKVAFDVVGAFTTIGLNTGISDWNIPCKLVLVVCMCFGKIGVLTIGLSLHNQNKTNRSAKK